MPTHFNIFNNLPNLEVANDVQQFFGRICGRKICESLVRGCTVYCTTLNLLEHLNLSWNNACACEHSRKPCEVVRNNLNHRNGRNQVGTNLETSLCMEELGDGFSFVFVGCGVFGCCLTHVLGT